MKYTAREALLHLMNSLVGRELKNLDLPPLQYLLAPSISQINKTTVQKKLSIWWSPDAEN